MNKIPKCPKCGSQYCYEDGHMIICPECSHEWNPEVEEEKEKVEEKENQVKDANGNILKDGDNVSVIKDLKVKGSSDPLKMGTTVRNIKLVDGDHNINCKIDGFGHMDLKSEFVKKI